MNYLRLHPWNVSTYEAKRIQLDLSARVVAEWDGREVSRIAAADVGFPRPDTVLAAVVVLTFPGLEVVETRVKRARCKFPYVPGYLSFREVPALLACLEKVRSGVDVLMCDAQGLAHPRKMGLATHMGLWLKTPTIGCAKTPLYGQFRMPATKKGAYTFIRDSNAPIGAVLRTRDNVKPLFISPGYKINLKDAIKVTLSTCTKYRIPQPLRCAHTLSKTTLKEIC